MPALTTVHCGRQLMALTYLPEEHITPVFESLCKKAISEPLRKFMECVEQIWIHNLVLFWEVKNRSVFNQAVRTNNDIEGWRS